METDVDGSLSFRFRDAFELMVTQKMKIISPALLLAFAIFLAKCILATF